MERFVDEILFLEQGGNLLITAPEKFMQTFQRYRLPRSGQARNPIVNAVIKNVETHADYWDIFSFDKEADLIKTLQDQGFDPAELRPLTMSLEDAFIVCIQYLPEMSQERLRLSLHLPVSPHRLIIGHVLIGLSAVTLIIALATAEDLHADKAYRDQDGNWFTRVAYEKQLPFIYYKNMELWGLLPLKLEGVELNKKTIKENRQVMELKPGNIDNHRPQIPLWPLLESNPKQARLVFPEDRFRITDKAIQFINVDTNTVKKELSELFTKALKAKGFIFPARFIS